MRVLKELRRKAAAVFKEEVDSLRRSVYYTAPPPHKGVIVLNACPRKAYKWMKHQYNMERRAACSSHSSLSEKSRDTDTSTPSST